MTALIGSLGVAIGFVGALGGIATLGLALATRDTARQRRSLLWVAVMVSGAVLATIAMEVALLRDDFSLTYVAENSTTDTPLVYKVATLWGALEGSLLLWALVLCVYVGAVAFVFRARIEDRLVAWSLLTMLVVGAFFFGLLVFPADPFTTLDVAPAQGNGLNPLLRNHPLMAIHPIMLYLGYVGFTVPFGFAVGALVTGRLGEGWLVATRVWTMIAWGSLGIGILLGAWWSYEVLGWGGYWAWDPVENASFLPWLTGTAFIHSVIVQERRGMLRVWNLCLLLATFALTIFGTFLTRSGVVRSVHEFSESSIGPLFLAFFTAIELDLQPIPPNKVLGICHFPTFYAAMDATRHIVELDPAAVELVDRTMVELARDIPAFRRTIEGVVVGAPEALLIVEFAGEDAAEQHRRLADLEELMGTLGFPGAMVPITDKAFQGAVTEVRKAGLNIMMSMKGDGKPVSFIEDCAVPLEDLAEYTDRLTNVFRKHGTYGTWYAHASVGCLHVRPVLNLKDEGDVRKMREIAEEAFAMVREYKGSHSGEHGDGIVRSEFHEVMFGRRLVGAFEDVKDTFDPAGLFNPGRVVRPPRMDDRSLMRFKPGFAYEPLETVLDWSDWGGFGGAVEMCNNNGACRKAEPGVMCPSFRATADEQHLTRGRANSLRLALSGQLGPDALFSDAMKEAMELCVGCKGCKRECPTGVDMARMKIEFLAQYRKRHGLKARERLSAYLPRYAPWASRLAWLFNLRDRVPGLAAASQALTGLSARRSLPRWRKDVFRAGPVTGGDGPDVVLLADTFNTYFEPENSRAALDVLAAGGYRVHVPQPFDGGRPLCCGRTFLSAGLVDEACKEAERLMAALRPYLDRGMPVIGLEPSCLLTLRDEYKAMLPGPETDALAASAVLFEEFLAAEHEGGRLALPLVPSPWRRALVHGHCHQHAFDLLDEVVKALSLVPELEVETLEAGCCGMAGTFGYEAEHFDLSMKMAEQTLLPAVRNAAEGTVIVADGTSCRHQVRDGSGKEALHVARILAAALDG